MAHEIGVHCAPLDRGEKGLFRSGYNQLSQGVFVRGAHVGFPLLVVLLGYPSYVVVILVLRKD